MTYTPRQYAVALYEVLEGTQGAERKNIISRFLEVLEKHRARHMERQILNHYEKIFLARHGMKKVDVVSASPLTDAVRKDIEVAIHEPMLMSETVDPSLLAGLTILIDDSVYIDASGRTMINNLF
jgi:F0F1-type ATP synthase delta subunit